MMGEDTMLMMQDQTDLMTNTCAAGVEKSMAVATDVPTHISNVHGQSAIDVTHLEATVVSVDSQPSDEKQEDEQQEEAVNGVHDTLEYGSSIAMSEHSRMKNDRDSGMHSVVSTKLNLDKFRFS